MHALHLLQRRAGHERVDQRVPRRPSPRLRRQVGEAVGPLHVGHRWNLAPLEERWEAVEECATLLEKSTLKAGDGKIELGTLVNGTELIRVGGATGAEFAARRYGDRLRVRRHVAITARTAAVAGTGGVAALLALSDAALATVSAVVQLSLIITTGVIMTRAREDSRVLHLPTSAGPITIRAKDPRLARLVEEPNEGGPYVRRSRGPFVVGGRCYPNGTGWG